MKSNTFITIAVPSPVDMRHRGAAKRLRIKLKDEAPTAEELIVLELSNRRVGDIVADFLQSNWRRRADHPRKVQIIKDPKWSCEG